MRGSFVSTGLVRIAFYGKLAGRAGVRGAPAARSSEMRSQGRRPARSYSDEYLALDNAGHIILNRKQHKLTNDTW